MKATALVVSALLTLVSNVSYAWDGTDATTGESVEIERGTLVRSGRDIEYINNDTGESKTANVEYIRRYGRTVEVEVTDNDTGRTRTLEMED